MAIDWSLSICIKCKKLGKCIPALNTQEYLDTSFHSKEAIGKYAWICEKCWKKKQDRKDYYRRTGR